MLCVERKVLQNILGNHEQCVMSYLQTKNSQPIRSIIYV